jgi:hypothetical protein
MTAFAVAGELVTGLSQAVEQFCGEIGHAAAGTLIHSRPTAMISIAMSHPFQDGSLNSMRSATIVGNTLRNSSKLAPTH